MSVNKLNLQIGGSREPEEDTLLEETGVSIEVDDLIADLFDDNKEEIVEEHGDFLVKALDNAMPERVVVAGTRTARRVVTRTTGGGSSAGRGSTDS